LLEHGANIDARTTKPWDDGYRGDFGLDATPLLVAAKGADAEMMWLLAANGADVMASNANGTTGVMGAAGVEMMTPNEDSGRDADAFTALQLAVRLGAGDVNGANKRSETALHGSVGRVTPEMATFLVEQGAKLDAKNRRGQMPIDVALTGAAVG